MFPVPFAFPVAVAAFIDDSFWLDIRFKKTQDTSPFHAVNAEAAFGEEPRSPIGARAELACGGALALRRLTAKLGRARAGRFRGMGRWIMTVGAGHV